MDCLIFGFRIQMLSRNLIANSRLDRKVRNKYVTPCHNCFHAAITVYVQTGLSVLCIQTVITDSINLSIHLAVHI